MSTCKASVVCDLRWAPDDVRRTAKELTVYGPALGPLGMVSYEVHCSVAFAAISRTPLSIPFSSCCRTTRYSALPSTISTAASTLTYQAVSLMRAGVKRRSSIPAAECISEPPHRADRIGLEPGRLQLPAHVVHVDVDDVRRRLESLAPHLFAQLVARQHLARVLHQVLEQRKLRAGQLDRAAVDPRLARTRVQLQRPRLDHLRRRLAAPAQRPQPRRQLAQRERLHQVVVRPRIQAADPVGNRAARRQ